MTQPKIAVDVKRSDGYVTRLTGDFAIAVVGEAVDIETLIQGIRPATVSLRCDNNESLALALASILSTVAQTAPDVIPVAVALAQRMDAARPSLHHKLPPFIPDDE